MEHLMTFLQPPWLVYNWSKQDDTKIVKTLLEFLTYLDIIRRKQYWNLDYIGKQNIFWNMARFR